jgi:hypothetical protein
MIGFRAATAQWGMGQPAAAAARLAVLARAAALLVAVGLAAALPRAVAVVD